MAAWQTRLVVEPEPAVVPPFDLLRPNRPIEGCSAILLPFTADGAIDWTGFDAHLQRTAGAGLVPAVNMDTGHVALLDDDTRTAVLDRTVEVLGQGSRFIGGAFVADTAGAGFDLDAHRRAAAAIAERGGTPVVFPSHGLASLPEDDLVGALATVGEVVDRFIAFELSPAFSPAGRIWSIDTFAGVLGITSCVGAKHSSLRRSLEWLRLRLRDARRPEFRVYTGNDLAIDMVMFGSDYLLGLSTFAPDLFARRDEAWRTGDVDGFMELNDGLQALGAFTFRDPVPAYRHSAAQFLVLRGWIGSDSVPPGALRRPDSDREVLATLGRHLGVVSP
jgi:dihydrodipicolinate synthase/N-acetylneuraminate lyase